MKLSKDLFDKIVVTYIRMGNNATDFMGTKVLANKFSCPVTRIVQVRDALRREKYIDMVGTTLNTKIVTIKSPSEKDREDLFTRYFMKKRQKKHDEVDSIITWLKRNGYSGVISTKSSRYGAQKIVSYTF